MTNRWQFCDDNTMSAWVILIINSILLGVGLAMDAFSVSVANGMQDPHMSTRRTGIIAGCFAGFQFLMPMLGWLCIHTVIFVFEMFRPFIPWIAFFLLLCIGSKMILDGVKKRGKKLFPRKNLLYRRFWFRVSQLPSMLYPLDSPLQMIRWCRPSQPVS